MTAECFSFSFVGEEGGRGTQCVELQSCKVADAEMLQAGNMGT